MGEAYTLLLVLGGSALAIGLIVLLNAVLGGWRSVKLTRIDQAEAFLARDVLGFRPSDDGALSQDGAAALVLEEGGGRLGLVAKMADRAVVRALRPGEVSTVSVDGPRLILSLADYTFPRVTLILGDADESRRWALRAGAFTVVANAA